MDTFLFDFDGTIINSLPVIKKTLIETKNRYHYKYDIEMAYNLIGTPLYEMGRILCGKEHENEFVDNYTIVNASFTDEIQIYGGFIQILYNLKLNNKNIGIVTSRRRKSLDILLRQLGLDKYIEFSVTKESVPVPKPAPDPVLFAIDYFKSKPSDTVMIGDTHFDLLSGKDAGCLTIGVLWGVDGIRLKNVSPDYLVSDTSDLNSIILSLL